jgi:positive regulator of sigma E activity
MELQSKSDWLLADFNTMVTAWAIMVMLVPLFGVFLYTAVGIDLFAFFRQATKLDETRFFAAIGLSVLPAFLLVFVFRRNFQVIGQQRDFRYFCRWL